MVAVENPKPDDLSRSAFFAGLFALILAYLAFNSYQLAQMPLIDPDEPRYAAAGRTMERGGSILVPEFNGEKRINKPPLFYWLVGLSMKLTGREDELAARLPSVLMGLLMLVMTACVGRRFYGGRTGLVAALVLASTALFACLSRACITDMTLSTFVASTAGLLLLTILSRERDGERKPSQKLFWLAVLVYGLGILTKATPAFALIAVVLIYRALSLSRAERAWAWRPILILFSAAIVFSVLAIYCAEKNTALGFKIKAASIATDPGVKAPKNTGWHTADEILNVASQVFAVGGIACILALAWRAGGGAFKRLPWVVGLSLAVACGVWWYMVLVQMFGWTEFKRLLTFEVAGRLAGGVHREGMHYYLENLITLTMPWSVALPGALICAWPGERSADESSTQHHADRYLVAWVAGVLLFFTIPGAKLATYILPAFPAVALLIARFVVRLSSTAEPVPASAVKATRWLVVVFCAILCVAGFVPVKYPDDFQRFLQALTVPFGVLGAGFGIAIVASWWVLKRRAISGVVMMYAATLVFVLTAAHAAFPVFLYGRSHKDLCMRIKNSVSDCERVVSYGAEREGLVFYLERPVQEGRKRLMAKNESYDAILREDLATPGGTAVIMQRRYFASIIGVKMDTLPTDPVELAKRVPPFAEFVASSNKLVVLRTLKAH